MLHDTGDTAGPVEGSISGLAAGLTLAIWGVVLVRASNSSSTFISSSASLAMAGRCSTALVEPQMAMVTLMALRMASLVRIWRAVMPFLHSSTMARPDSKEWRRRPA